MTPLIDTSTTVTALLNSIHNFGWGSAQLRAAASLGGSVVFAPTYSNFVPLLCALGATLVFVRAVPGAGTSAIKLEQRPVIASTDQFLPDGETSSPLSENSWSAM